ncbi:outer membrane beta-barrel protein [Hyphomicrobium sp.]|uniref:outer membrane protein n=1 Tax=Hyphomicrobium sp. TaxID=82 RepID=UPI0025B94832|nr:outer membrane beta-barrel protein [Hyphomicrobium sp.]MCC7252669.1 porin family protein [Hyphomicrobium sp.]
MFASVSRFPAFVGRAALTATAIALFAASARAEWSGPYIGIHAGYGWSEADATISPADPLAQNLFDDLILLGIPFSTLSTDGDGVLGGAQVGFNSQSGSFVWGIEADISYADIDGSANASRTIVVNLTDVTLTEQAASELDWFGTLRLRGGVLLAPETLVYATGGLAYGRVTHSWSSTFPASATLAAGSDRNWEIGWTVGAGAEFKLSDTLSLRGEYLYYDLGDSSYSAPFAPNSGVGDASLRVESENTGSIVRAALNFKLE